MCTKLGSQWEQGKLEQDTLTYTHNVVKKEILYLIK